MKKILIVIAVALVGYLTGVKDGRARLSRIRRSLAESLHPERLRSAADTAADTVAEKATTLADGASGVMHAAADTAAHAADVIAPVGDAG